METESWEDEQAGPAAPSTECDLAVTENRQIRYQIRQLLDFADGLLVDDAVLVTDELVSNARRHGAPPSTCRLDLRADRRSLRIEVDDTAPGEPRIREPDETGGRGLILVDRLATAWGVQHHGGHKTVWAEFVLDQPGTSGHAPHLTSAPRGPRPS